MCELSGRVAIVTGASQGIGEKIALVLAENGANVAVFDVSDQISEVTKKIEKLGSQGLAVKCDVTNPDQVNGAVKQVLKRFGKLDILVNNAGIYHQTVSGNDRK
jgi:NAD(P)-dependent dehydrogenase (short-subunit alcohol dehydrogenase family)